MFEWQDLILLTLVGVGSLIWWQGQGVRELALHTAKQQCQQHNLQLLDQSVALRGVGWQRNDQGQFCLRRVYHFEFSNTGDERSRGVITVLGGRVSRVQLDAYPLT